MGRNIFDDEIFFEGYKTTRNKTESYNNLVEQPVMKSLLPDLKNKSVLDMGCGFGYNCADFIKRGAARGVGIDISEKMLNIAKQENNGENIQYLHMDMEHINEIGETFDFVYSSLAIHYIANFDSLIKKVHNILNNGVYFCFLRNIL